LYRYSVVPKFYFRCLATVEESIETMFADKPAIKKMSSTNAKAFNSLRQRLKKHQREDKAMQVGIAAAKEKMDSTDEEASSESDSDSDSGSDSDEVGLLQVESS
jgi:translation initiation factor 3 subunit C